VQRRAVDGPRRDGVHDVVGRGPLGLREAQVVRHGDRAGHPARVQEDHQVRARRQREAHPLPRPDALRDEPRGGLGGAPGELRVGDPVDRLAVRAPRGRPQQPEIAAHPEERTLPRICQ
jgi:hypothetical protein